MLITSPEKGDGKTLTAVNMAITMAQSGKRTILVDADLRRPNAHNMLDLSSHPGLAELLNGSNGQGDQLPSPNGNTEIQPGVAFPGDAPRHLAPFDHIQATEVDRLSFLAAGRTELPPAESLGGDGMADLLRQLRASYDVVIVDSPPVLAVSDPVLLSTEADATLLVVAADRTDFKAIDVTEKTLGAVGVPIAGVIFNRFDERKRRGGYSYGYDYEKTYGYVLED
jgi:tyrosine-protein kinase Etk/Wzc